VAEYGSHREVVAIAVKAVDVLEERATSVRVGVAPLQWGSRVQYANPLRFIGSFYGLKTATPTRTEGARSQTFASLCDNGVWATLPPKSYRLESMCSSLGTRHWAS